MIELRPIPKGVRFSKILKRSDEGVLMALRVNNNRQKTIDLRRTPYSAVLQFAGNACGQHFMTAAAENGVDFNFLDGANFKDIYSIDEEAVDYNVQYGHYYSRGKKVT